MPKVVIVEIKVNGESVEGFEASDYKTYDEMLDEIRFALKRAGCGLENY
jgi:hypothetical protein